MWPVRAVHHLESCFILRYHAFALRFATELLKLPPLTPCRKRPYISCPRPASAHLYVQPIALLIAGSVLQPPYYMR